MPSAVSVETAGLQPCLGGCQSIPAEIVLSLVGTCTEGFAPLFYGLDSSGNILAIIEWDPNNGCFILTLQGSPAADSSCQPIIWSGYGAALQGTYVRLCGSDGGCDANLAVLTLTVG
jgi:hypothetical protein